MSRKVFSSALGYVGALGGVVIAVGVPWIVLVYGGQLSSSVQATVIILALISGAVVAVASTIVGITIPTAIQGGKFEIGRCPDTCCDDEEKAAPEGEVVS
jgi:hypothetical protein